MTCGEAIATTTAYWWEGAGGAVVSALLGALIGSCVPLVWAWWVRRTERLGEIRAMQVEMYHAHCSMKELRTTKDPVILAPLYQLPLTMFERALPKLIGEGLLAGEEVSGLVEYVMRAEELNRGLALAVSVSAAQGDTPALRQQYYRNCLKTANIVDEKQHRLGDRAVFDVAYVALYRLSGDARPELGRATEKGGAST
jgi:hypothetical protein